jgi:hypothetical protein
MEGAGEHGTSEDAHAVTSGAMHRGTEGLPPLCLHIAFMRTGRGSLQPST